MEAYTDCPILMIGDVPNEEAPIRKIIIKGSDFKYIWAVYYYMDLIPIRVQIKRCYVYETPGRVGYVKSIREEVLRKRKKKQRDICEYDTYQDEDDFWKGMY